MTGSEARDYLRRHEAAMFTARVTGRIIFGQLWMPDPTFDLIARAYYQDFIGEALNRHTALAEYFV